jgi:hypothetical protein
MQKRRSNFNCPRSTQALDGRYLVPVHMLAEHWLLLLLCFWGQRTAAYTWADLDREHRVHDKAGYNYGALPNQNDTVAANITLKILVGTIMIEGFAVSPAEFGVPDYGKVVSGRVMYGSFGSRDGCRPIDSGSVHQWPYAQPVIIMLERGGCGFKEKVLHAQAVGAIAVLLIHDK